MNYSVLLPRSVDFDVYATILNPAYPKQSDRPLVLGLAQILWDRGEPDGVAAHMTDRPAAEHARAPGAACRSAFGDHQVSTFQAEVEARTIGARVHQPALPPAARRSRRRCGASGAPRARSPARRIVLWDAGAGTVAPPPLTNSPPRDRARPARFPRSTPAAREQKSQFLRAGGAVVDTCGGAPCASVTSSR